MRILFSLLLTVLVTGGALPFQDPAPKPTDDPQGAPFTVMRERERARLTKELPGNWILMTFESPTEVIDPRDVRGFATFCAGYLSLSVQARTVEKGFFGPYPEYWVYSGHHRYKITDQVDLEATCTMAFNNMNAEAALVAEPAGVVRTYRVELRNEELTLVRPDGAKFVFRRVDDAAETKR